MGVVYFGVNPRLHTEVAIKVLPKKLQDQEPETVDRFVREAQLAAQLQSPHLVGVLDVDEDEDSGAHYIVMDFVRGKSAREWMMDIARSGMRGAQEKAALEVVIGATRGLVAAHLEGVLHRDFKPHNILIPEEDGQLQYARAKLADLGLARHETPQEEITTTQMGMGTPGYAAPEQSTDARQARKPADVFGAGATLYALLTGRRAFEGANAVESVIKAMKGEYTPVRQLRPDVSKGTGLVIQKCLSPEPKERFPDAPALLEALEVCYRALDQKGAATENTVQVVSGLVRRKERGKRVGSTRSRMRRTKGYRRRTPVRRRQSQTGMLLALGAAVVAVLVAAVMMGGGDAVEAGLLVDSRPQGASVSIDGKPRGKTPLFVADLGGTHEVKLTLGGYRDRILPVTVKQGRRVEMQPHLERVTGRARLEIQSTPAGAEIVVDGRHRGRTPKVITELAGGKHSVRIKLDGHDTYETQVDLPTTGQKTIDAKLLKQGGKLTLTGGPPGARVVLSGRREYTLELDLSGHLSAELAQGKYKLTVSRPGHDTFVRTITVRRNSPALVKIAMAEHDGTLRVDSKPQGATVIVDGDVRGKTPLRELGLGPGQHRVKLTLDEHFDEQRVVSIKGAQLLDLGTIELAPWSTLDLSKLGAGVTVKLAGTEIGDGARLRPGRHVLTLERPGYGPQTVFVQVRPGQAARVTAEPWAGYQAKLELVGLPEGARAFVMGRDLTGGTYVSPEPVTVEVTLTRPGYEQAKVKVTLELGGSTRLPSIAWSKIETRLDLSDYPAGSKLMLGSKAYVHLDVLPPGDHAGRILIGRRSGKTARLKVVSQDYVRPPLAVLKEKPVQRALAWLKNHQGRQGEWAPSGFTRLCGKQACTGTGQPGVEPGITGLVLLCYLRAGHPDSSGEYKETVNKGLAYLLKLQGKDGCLGNTSDPRFAYNHACAALAVVEAYRLSESQKLRMPAQRAVEFVQKCRNPNLAWRYHVGGGDNDTSVTGWMVRVLKAGEAAGLKVDQKAYEGAKSWIDRMTDASSGRVGYQSRGGNPERSPTHERRWLPDQTESITALATHTRLILGGDPRGKSITKSVKRCTNLLPRWLSSMTSPVSTVDMYYWYWGSLLAYQVGGSNQKKWDRALRKEVTKRQHPEGSGHRAGSWDPDGPWGSVGGRLYSTALICLSLEAGYRHDAISKR